MRASGLAGQSFNLSFLKNLKIALKISLGNGIILVLLFVLSALAVISLNKASRNFDHYGDIARLSNALNDVEIYMLLTRMGVKDFLIRGDEESINRAIKNGNITQEKIRVAQQMDMTAEDQVIVDSLGGKVLAYDDAFDQVSALQTQRDEQVTLLSREGAEIRNNLQAVMQTAFEDDDERGSLLGGQAMTHLMLGRLYAERFLEDNKPGDAERAEEELTEFFNIVDTMLTELQDAERLRLAGMIREDGEDFLNTFLATVSLINQKNKIVAEQLDVIGPLVAETVADLVAANTEEQTALGEDIAETMRNAITMMLGFAILAIVIGVGAAIVIANSIARPILSMTKAMQTLAGGDKTVEIPATDHKDEVGEMAVTVQVFKDNLIKNEEMQAQQMQEQQAQVERAERVAKLTQSFDEKAAEMISTVSSAATEMEATSRNMSSAAEQTSTQSTSVAAASEQALQNVQTVAASAEELSSSITEISRQVSQSSKLSADSARDAERTNDIVKGLSEAVGQIDSVIGLINDIADQTNLLALNATIEAARAGEAGKGFAVVANEVKSLATQTGKATEEIAGHITAIQGSTTEAVTAIENIVGRINELNEVATTIASAVEEQGSATEEIARNVQEAANGTNEVTSNIAGVSQAANITGESARDVLGAAQDLSKQSVDLKDLVENFLTDVRAA